MEFFCDSKYIAFPVSRSAVSKNVRFYIENEFVLDLNISIDNISPEYTAYYDVQRFYGKNITLKCVPEADFDITKSDVIPKIQEPYRPKIHFSPPSGWLNDPNGLVFKDGEYHMYYQHNPVGTNWGNMHWGHAVSKDLFRWTHLDEALFPTKFGTVFSGCAIVDKSGETQLFFTAAGGTSLLSEGKPFTQCIAGYENNPVILQIEEGNRDPKIIYHKKTERYIMVLYLSGCKYALLSSEDLKSWSKFQEIELEGDAECPDLYPLLLDNDPDREKWVLTGAKDKYIIGNFDGFKFTPETKTQTLEQGNIFYASQTWSDTPGRTIRIGWCRFNIPSKSFQGCMSVPCEMSLKSTKNGMRLCTYPVPEIQTLYESTMYFDEVPATVPLNPCAYDIEFELCASARLCIFGTAVDFDMQAGKILCGKSEAVLYSEDKTISVRIISDTPGLEIFAQNGEVYLIAESPADYNANCLEITPISGGTAVKNLKIRELKNAYF